MAVEFRTKLQYDNHLKCLLLSLPHMIPDLVQIVQQYSILEIVVGMHLDCLDTEQIWLEAEILDVSGNSAYIGYIGYTRWDEWIDLDSETNQSRLAVVHTFTPTDEAACRLNPELQLSQPTAENKACRIVRLVERGWREKDVIALYEKVGWYRTPFQILYNLKSYGYTKDPNFSAHIKKKY